MTKRIGKKNEKRLIKQTAKQLLKLVSEPKPKRATQGLPHIKLAAGERQDFLGHHIKRKKQH